ncbi:MAG TPA: hypothetical protein VHE30_06125 [Polyangiaceae bacterium]|nr:hypothetical protein [Polyangiaceae bacterium]
MFDRTRTLRLARRFEETDQLREAIREYGKLSTLDPGDVSSLHRIADLELRLGRPADAAETQEKLAGELARKGRRLAALFRYKKALEQRRALPADPEDGESRILRSLEALKSEVKRRRAEIAPLEEAAARLEQRGIDAELVKLLSKMVELEQDNPVYLARLAETHCRLGRPEDAIPVFRAAARVLCDFDRLSDALRVLERLFHFRAEHEDELFAARLYLARGERKDAVRAVGKLHGVLTHDPESLDALALLARGFLDMGQPARSAQVRVEMARIAKEAGEDELLRDLVAELERIVPDDPFVRALAAERRPVTSSAPALSVRTSFASVIVADLDELEEELGESPEAAGPESSVVDDIEEVSVLSEVWLNPVVTREARRALDDAEAFRKLRLYEKAEDALLVAIEEDPVCGELREALRAIYKERGDVEGFVDETVVLADLYRQRRFFDRARTLLGEVFEIEPAHAEARRLRSELDAVRDSSAATR